jgi:hypothetical protein
MTDREWLLADSMRLEDAAPDASKPLWIVSRSIEGVGEQVLILEALTAPGARAVGEALELVGSGDPDGSLRLAGPISRAAWPKSLWYRWLTQDDVVDFFQHHLPELPKGPVSCDC